MILEQFYPREWLNSTYEIPWEQWQKKGIRGVIFDIDNTLVEHDQPVTLPAIELFENLKEMGFKTCIISNNKDYRVKPLADALESEYVYKAGKPSKAGYEKGMEIMGTNRENTLFIGDQIFTDIWGANKAGIHSILVKPIAKHEEIQIVLKRKLEKIVLGEYNKTKRKAQA